MDIERDTIYGYPVKDLILVAMALKEADITKEDLYDFRLNCELAYSIVKAEFDKQVKETIENQMAAMWPKTGES